MSFILSLSFYSSFITSRPGPIRVLVTSISLSVKIYSENILLLIKWLLSVFANIRTLGCSKIPIQHSTGPLWRVHYILIALCEYVRCYIPSLPAHARGTPCLNWFCIYTMHNFSNCFVWTSPSTTDAVVKIQAPIICQEFPLKNTKLPNATPVLKWRYILRLACHVGNLIIGGAKTIFKRLFGHWKQKKNIIENAAIIWTFSEK